MTQARMWRWLLAGLLSIAATLAQADEALWALLQKGGQVAALRKLVQAPRAGHQPAPHRRPGHAHTSSARHPKACARARLAA